MNKILLGFLISLISLSIQSQTIECLTKENDEWIKERNSMLNSNNPKNINVLKLVRVNVHFILKSDGSGNFNENGDNQGNALNGYQFAKDIVKSMNISLSYNQQMNIPPNNNTPALNKNLFIVLDAVYFHRNNALYNSFDINTAYNTYGQNKTQVFNIFIFHDVNGRGGAFASDLSCSSSEKFIGCRNYYKRYVDFLNQVVPGDQYEWVMHGLHSEMLHEIGHLLGLSHTIRYNWAPPCPTMTANGFVDTNCDDGCNDTPTAWAIHDNSNYPNARHPACGWIGWPFPSYCSNNMMDYNGQNAATPCQLEIMHTCLENGLRMYTVCRANETDANICSISYPNISYYGKNITVGCNVNYLNILTEGNVYFSNNVDFSLIDVQGNGQIEFFFHTNCN